MDSYEKLMTQVIAGDASQSELYKQVLNNFMPVGSPLSVNDKDRIRDWINAGALP